MSNDKEKIKLKDDILDEFLDDPNMLIDGIVKRVTKSNNDLENLFNSRAFEELDKMKPIEISTNK